MVALAETRFCRHLTPGDQRFVAERATEHRFEPDQLIFEEGDKGDGIYVIIDGGVEIFAHSVPNRQHVLSRMEPGDYFGEMATFDGGNRSASARASGYTILSFIPVDVVLDLLMRSPLLSATLVRDASLRMREFNRRFLRESLNAERVQLVERLAGTIVHDFRNPLNVIGLAADIAGQESATVEMRRSARDRIRKQVEVLNQMMQELLDFTRSIPARAILPRIRYVQFVQEIIEEVRTEAERRGVEVRLEGVVPDLWVRIDPPRLTRVFNNLCQNAFDAMSGVEEARLIFRFYQEADAIVSEIADTGCGIQREHQPHIFEPFFTFGKTHGTGLGLAICERIIRESGGTIDAWSEPGRGAVFRFRLPIAKPGDTDRAVTGEPGRRAGT